MAKPSHLITCRQFPHAVNAVRPRAVVEALAKSGRVVIYELGSRPDYEITVEQRRDMLAWLHERDVDVVTGFRGDEMHPHLHEAMRFNGGRPFDAVYSWHFAHPPLVFPSVKEVMPNAVRICDADVLPGRMQNQVDRARSPNEHIELKREAWGEVLDGLLDYVDQIWLSSPREQEILATSLEHRVARAEPGRYLDPICDVRVVSMPAAAPANHPLDYAQRERRGELTGNFGDAQNIYGLKALLRTVQVMPKYFRCELIGPNLDVARKMFVGEHGQLDKRFHEKGFVTDEELNELVSTSLFSFSLGPAIGVPQKVLYAIARGTVAVVSKRTAVSHGFTDNEVIIAGPNLLGAMRKVDEPTELDIAEAERDIRALADRITEVMESEAEWSRLSRDAVDLSRRYSQGNFEASINTALAAVGIESISRTPSDGTGIST